MSDQIPRGARLGVEHRVGAGNIHLTIRAAVRAATDLAAPKP
jgi:hypothetical protein